MYACQKPHSQPASWRHFHEHVTTGPIYNVTFGMIKLIILEIKKATSARDINDVLAVPKAEPVS